jgi:two-component system chemotaxis sensor kinase CheA
MADPLRYFRIEARELLDGLVAGAVALEQGGAAADVAPAMLRMAHTLKGAARIVRQPEIADHAHGIEEVLGPSRDAPGPLGRDHLGILFSLLDEIRVRVDGLAAPPTTDAPPATEARSLGGPRADDDGAASVRTDVAEVDALIDDVGEVSAGLGRLRERAEAAARARAIVDALAVQVPSGHRMRPLADQLRRLMGDLHQALDEGLDQLDRELQQVRDDAERLRLAPLASLFRPLEHAARDVARAQGKQVTFAARGGDVRFDAHLVATLHRALEQVVRNAVAHGIEVPDERRRAGKPVEGAVTVEVARRGQRAVFTCHDDGAGIDVAAVRDAARAQGLLAAGDGDGADAVLRLLFAGGLSTTGEVTELSGRGIGLDIARDAVERLGGRITARTELGAGTTIEIDVPLALSALPALTVEAGDRAVVLPLDAVRRVVRVSADDLVAAGPGQALVHDGATVPFVPLASLVGAAAPSTASAAWSAVVLEAADGSTAAVGVQRLVARASVVVRPLPELTPSSPLVTGVSLDGRGEPQLVLDPRGLVAAAGRALAVPAVEVERAPVLVVDDSLTTRMLERTILESAGYEVDVAVSGEDALQQIERRRYGLLLVDVEMPGIDGFTFIEHVRAHPTLHDTPCIFVTSRATPEDRRRGADLGARAYVVKGEFDQLAILDHLREVIGG